MNWSIHKHAHCMQLCNIQGSEEGSNDQQMTPECLNQAFSKRATQQKPWKNCNEPYDTYFQHIN